MGTEHTRVDEGTLESRHHFETGCGSYMGGDTLGSMQQSSPTNLTVEATILPEVIRTVDPML